MILVKTSSSAREELERIENNVYSDKDEIISDLCFNEGNPIATDDVSIVEMTDFMDMCNNTDDDVVEFNTDNHWVGYVQLK